MAKPTTVVCQGLYFLGLDVKRTWVAATALGGRHGKSKSRGHLISEKTRLHLDLRLNSFGSQSQSRKSHSSKKIKAGSGPALLHPGGRENNFVFYQKRRSRILPLDAFLGQK